MKRVEVIDDKTMHIEPVVHRVKRLERLWWPGRMPTSERLRSKIIYFHLSGHSLRPPPT